MGAHQAVCQDSLRTQQCSCGRKPACGQCPKLCRQKGLGAIHQQQLTLWFALTLVWSCSLVCSHLLAHSLHTHCGFLPGFPPAPGGEEDWPGTYSCCGLTEAGLVAGQGPHTPTPRALLLATTSPRTPAAPVPHTHSPAEVFSPSFPPCNLSAPGTLSHVSLKSYS